MSYFSVHNYLHPRILVAHKSVKGYRKNEKNCSNNKSNHNRKTTIMIARFKLNLTL